MVISINGIGRPTVISPRSIAVKSGQQSFLTSEVLQFQMQLYIFYKLHGWTW